MTTAAFEAARVGAAEGGGGCAQVDARVRVLLGTYGQRVQVGCGEHADQLRVQVTAPSPARLLDGFGQGLGRPPINRTVVVAREPRP